MVTSFVRQPIGTPIPSASQVSVSGSNRKNFRSGKKALPLLEIPDPHSSPFYPINPLMTTNSHTAWNMTQMTQVGQVGLVHGRRHWKSSQSATFRWDPTCWGAEGMGGRALRNGREAVCCSPVVMNLYAHTKIRPKKRHKSLNCNCFRLNTGVSGSLLISNQFGKVRRIIRSCKVDN